MLKTLEVTDVISWQQFNNRTVPMVRLRPTPKEDESLVCGEFWMIPEEILHCA